MIMNGMLHTPSQLNGKLSHKAIIFILVILFTLVACSEGRGDWTQELHSGYAISCVNSNEIVIVRKERSDQIGYSFVIDNFYVSAYWTNSHYIGLKGIQTKDIIATDEELNSGISCYYLVNTTDAKVLGPFESEEVLIEFCSEMNVELAWKWINTID